MDTANIRKLLIRLRFDEPGTTDSKLSASTKQDMTDVVNMQRSSFVTGDIVWIVADRAFYMLDLSVSGEVRYTPVGSTKAANTFYGEENNVGQYLGRGDFDYRPSAKSYTDGDAIIAGNDLTVNGVQIKKFDIYVVSIISEANQDYVYAGTLVGSAGATGEKGDTGTAGADGATGAPMTVDAQGLLASIGDYCSELKGFAYLATDTGNLYFKLTAPTAAGCDINTNWSTPIPFGKGDAGQATFFIFTRSGSMPSTPQVSDPSPAGWFDSVPTGSNPAYMSKTSYQIKADGTINPADFAWSLPTMLTGEDGIDGTEGRSAGFWVIWNDAETPSNLNDVPVPVLGAAPVIPSGSTWYDDISIDSVPIWMGQALYDQSTSSWKPWRQVRVGGERVPYKVNIFLRSLAQPSTPVFDVVYKHANGEFSSGADAAAGAGGGWSDAPPSGTYPLYMSEVSVSVDGPNTAWSPPVKIDGEEGVSAGVWVVWSDLAGSPASPPKVEDIISADGSALDLSGTSWYDDVGITDDPTNMATAFYKPKGNGMYEWTAWSIAKIKGEQGVTGAPGAAARAYFPVTLFTRAENDISTDDAIGLYVVGDDSTGYNLAATSPNTASPPRIVQEINGVTYTFTDGVPPITDTFPGDSAKVWMIQTTLDSVSNLGSGQRANWGRPALLIDSQKIDFQYHNGSSEFTAGEKPNDPVGGADPDAEGWYSQPADLTFWIAQKNHTEGPAAQWAVYQSRGDSGVERIPGKIYDIQAPAITTTSILLAWPANPVSESPGVVDLWRVFEYFEGIWQVVGSGTQLDPTELLLSSYPNGDPYLPGSGHTYKVQVTRGLGSPYPASDPVMFYTLAS